MAELKAGDGAPDFTLPSTAGEITLSHLLRDKKVVLAFYYEDNTPTCSSQVASFKEDRDALEELDARVVAVSADSLASHERFAERLGGLPFPLASDEDLSVARLYDVVDETGKRCRRAVFVIDRDGTILASMPHYTPADLSQYEQVFRALGLE